MQKLTFLMTIFCSAALTMGAVSADETADEGKDLGQYMEEWAEEMAPLLDELRERIVDFSKYEAPEILPNGDIIIRRKRPLEGEEAEGNEAESIEL